eukprot:g1868.t1
MKTLLLRIVFFVAYLVYDGRASSIVRKGDEDVPVVTIASQNGGNASLTVSPGEDFIVQLSDFSSTGFRWFMDSVTPEGLAAYNYNKSGGGVTAPPYVNVSFTAGDGVVSAGVVTLMHAKPWERDDPSAEKGYARVSLVVEEHEHQE